ncbi:hypothetical protein [Mesotoga sp.]|uniref:hypothetical protein n=1 Tax=Mesotoga sp. TaxID=2053577 RepID=UPI00345E77A6
MYYPVTAYAVSSFTGEQGPPLLLQAVVPAEAVDSAAVALAVEAVEAEPEASTARISSALLGYSQLVPDEVQQKFN